MPITVKFHGQEAASGRIRTFRTTTLDKLEREVSKKTQRAASNIRGAMLGAYGQGSGRVARSIKPVVRRQGGSITAEIKITKYRELQYMTDLLGGDYHPVPYPIVAHGKHLKFYWKRYGYISFAKQVLHSGFPQGDILLHSADVEMSQLGLAVTLAFRQAVADITVA